MIDKDLLVYIKEKAHLLVLVVALSLLCLASSISFTFFLCASIGKFVDGDMAFGLLFLGFGACLALTFAGMSVLKAKLSNALADFVSSKIHKDIYDKYVRLEGESRLKTQEIAQLSSEGVEQLRLYYSSYLPSFFYAMLASISLFVFFCFFSWKVAIVYLVAIPLIPASIIAVSKWAKKIFAQYWNKYLSLGGSYLDALSGMKELLIFHYDEKMLHEMKANSNEFRKITMKVLVMQLFSTTIMDLVAYLGAGIGIAFTLLELDAGGIDYVSALFMCLVGAEFFLPLRALGSAFHIAMNGATAGKKVLGLLREEEPIEGTISLKSIHRISLKGVSFKYPDGDRKVVQRADIELSTGFISLLGDSGSGKSTLAHILSSDLKGYGGSILVDGNELRELNRRDYRKRVAYLSSESYLLNRSIRETFRFYNPAIEEKQMLSLLEVVSLKDRFNGEEGLDYVPKEDSSNLSGGEKQRLLLAYYLSMDKDFYIFDEVTSNIDKDSEEIILNKIKELARTHLVLFISHRYKNALNADRVYLYSQDGSLRSSTPSELLTIDPAFRNQIENEKKWEEIL